MGSDLNRVWQEPSPWAHPELFAAKAEVLNCNKDPVRDIDYWILFQNFIKVMFWLIRA